MHVAKRKHAVITQQEKKNIKQRAKVALLDITMAPTMQPIFQAN